MLLIKLFYEKSQYRKSETQLGNVESLKITLMTSIIQVVYCWDLPTRTDHFIPTAVIQQGIW